MSVDSVRRMLRGETYSNVGQEMPTRETPEEHGGDAVESLKRLTQAAVPAGEDFRPPETAFREADEAREADEEGLGHESAIEVFLKGEKR